jgi:hypothetical protein
MSLRHKRKGNRNDIKQLNKVFLSSTIGYLSFTVKIS